MRILPLAFGGLALLGSAIPALAQTPEPQPTPRFYVGLGAYSSYYQKLGGRFGSTAGFAVPLQLTAGYQLRPRLAVQVGMAYSGSSFTFDNEGYLYTNGGTTPAYFRYAGTSTTRTTSVSALARYTLTRKPAHRMQFDALGGLSLEHGSGYNRGTQANSVSGSLQTLNYSYRGSQNALLLTLGLGTRYRLTPRVELTFDYTVNYNIPTDGDAYQIRGLTGAAALGLRYRFGQH